MIVIIDYKVGNIGSIKNMITKIGYECKISNQKKDIEHASKLILPGVGSYDNGVENLKKLSLFDLINKKVIIDKTPILGICLGMQLMAKKSEEGFKKGFGWIDTTVIKVNEEEYKENSVPILGWNYIKTIKKNLILGDEKQRYYFVHSYYFPLDTPGAISCANVGFEYCAAFQKENIFGVQFHPEKSHNFGKKVFKKFCDY